VRLKSTYFATALVSGATAVMLVTAPAAMAAPTPNHSCAASGLGDTVCQSPGNVQIDNSIQVQSQPDYSPWEFGYLGADGFHGHSGGFGHGGGAHR
jgi:hypothetical protein